MSHDPKDRPEGGAASCLYQCELCHSQEEIPKEVLDYFDEMDPGLPGDPATFRCQHCPGLMYPAWFLRAKRATP